MWKKKMLKIEDMYPVMQPSNAVALYSLLLYMHFSSFLDVAVHPDTHGTLHNLPIPTVLDGRVSWALAWASFEPF